MPDVKELTIQSFDTEVIKESDSNNILVDFWAPWCGPCRMQGPVVDKLAEAGYHVAKVNIDEEPDLAERYSVMTIPTLMVFKDGEIKDQFIGVQSQETLEEALSK